MDYGRSDDPCPKCGGETDQDSVDIGVGVIHGPRGCRECRWSEAAEYDLSDGRSPVDDLGSVIDQYGGYHPPKSSMALAYRLAEDKEEKLPYRRAEDKPDFGEV